MFRGKSYRSLKLNQEKIQQEAKDFIAQLNEEETAFTLLKEMQNRKELQPYKDILYKACKKFRTEEFLDFLQLYMDFIGKSTIEKWKQLYVEFIMEGGGRQLNIEDEVQVQLKEVNLIVVRLNFMDASCFDCLKNAVSSIFNFYYLSVTSNDELMKAIRESTQQYVFEQTGKKLKLDEPMQPQQFKFKQ